MIKNAIDYAKIDEQVSDKVLNKMTNHLWYLADESLGLAFFDSSISVDEKRKMVKALKINTPEKKRVNTTLVELKTKYKDKELSDFVNANTLKFFDRFDITREFLNTDPESWHEREDYNRNRIYCSIRT